MNLWKLENHTEIMENQETVSLRQSSDRRPTIKTMQWCNRVQMKTTKKENFCDDHNKNELCTIPGVHTPTRWRKKYNGKIG